MVSSRILDGLLVVACFGALLAAPLATQFAETNAETSGKLRIVQLKSTESDTFVVFRPKELIKATDKLKVQLFKGNGTNDKIDGEDLDLTTAYLEITGRELEPYNEYTIRVMKGAEPLLTQSFRSSPGTPSKVSQPDWEMTSDGDSSKANLHWDQPLQPKGPINGYEIQHCYRDIITPGQRTEGKTEEPKLTCEDKSTEATSIQIDVQRGKRYETKIRAFNYDDPDFGSTERKKLRSEWETVNPSNDKTTPAPAGNNATVAVLIVISVLLSLVIVGYAGYKYYRKNYN